MPISSLLFVLLILINIIINIEMIYLLIYLFDNLWVYFDNYIHYDAPFHLILYAKTNPV